VKLDLPPVQGLRSGQFGRVSVPAGSAAVLHVPEPALIVRGQLEYVMVQEEGVARLRLVRTGRRQSGRVSVVSGLNAGERVVVAGLDGLRDGQAVEVRP
jgi:multidrug efflux pump subunit AcrA (membrane-fusion protein)